MSTSKNQKKVSSKKNISLPLLLVGLIFVTGLSTGVYFYRNKVSATQTPVATEQTSQPSSSIPSQNTNNASVAASPMHPRITIPNKPGNVKELLTILANKSGLQIDWKLKGYYNLTAQEITQFNNPIGLVITPLTDMMTLHNKELKIKWTLGNEGEPFPYPTSVMSLICDKTLMLFELEDPTQIRVLLDRPDFKHCAVPDTMLGSTLVGPEMKNYDFSQPPPFLKPYDSQSSQPQSTDATKIMEAPINNQVANNPNSAQFNWTTPQNGGQIEFVPTLPQEAPPPQIRGASSVETKR